MQTETQNYYDTHFLQFSFVFPFFASGNAISVSECWILVSECRLYFSMWFDHSEASSKVQNVVSVSEERFLLRIRLLFQDIAFHFRRWFRVNNSVSSGQECHLHFRMV